jgi:hypothetical protein
MGSLRWAGGNFLHYGNGIYREYAPQPENKRPVSQWLGDREEGGGRVGSGLRKRTALALAGAHLAPAPVGFYTRAWTVTLCSAQALAEASTQQG